MVGLLLFGNGAAAKDERTDVAVDFACNAILVVSDVGRGRTLTAGFFDNSRATLLAIPGATAEVVDTYIAQRTEALATKLAPPPFPVAGAIAGAINLWRIRAEVTMGDGVKFVREAVIRPGDQRRLLTVMEWQDGAIRAPVVASDQQGNAKNDATKTQ